MSSNPKVLKEKCVSKGNNPEETFFESKKAFKSEGGVNAERNVPLLLETKEELPDYWKKAELKMPGARAEIVIDYYNRRIKVMDYTGLFEEISRTLESFAKVEEIEKIIVYIPPEKKHEAETCEYAEEGIIRGYYPGKNCHIFSSYPKNSRGISLHKEKEDRIIESCLKMDRGTGKIPQKPENSREKGNWKKQQGKIQLPEEYTVRPSVQADTSAMAILYRQGFQFYPTPIHMESYLLKTMDSNVLYFLVEKQGKIVSLASAEMDPENGSAEITDCLTIPYERGKGLIKELITALEKELSDRGFQSTYTLCRALSSGINTAFASLGYAFTGRLVNNCRIMGGFEDINIWCKTLGRE
ncbi:MAG: putative beta-lysine N-acetyltransferase [Methanosarcina sp.]